MNVKVHSNQNEAAQEIALEIKALRSQSLKETLNLGFATGSSMIPVYAALRKELGKNLQGLFGWNLDEYWPLKSVGELSFSTFMKNQIPGALNPPRLPATDFEGQELEDFCQNFELDIRKGGGIDLQLLGIGINGHIGFNEPGSEITSRTRLVRLSQSTIQRAGFLQCHAPKFAITQGVATILETKRIRIVAFGAEKSAAIAKAIHGPQDPQCPASFLQKHRDVIWHLDSDAAKLLG
ncbi:MAG TPA: glucosamine-6-phosphate deaminase [Planctomycetota bacterium]|nr:glucosamine-6-phosphate deaminase [Planctomycetota bacterium]